MVRSPPRPPALLVHGIDDTAAVFDPLAGSLEALGVGVYRLSMTPPHGQARLEDLAAQLEQFVRRELPQGPFDLLGFSMGGLVSRFYLQRLGGLARVRRFVGVSVPHRGTLTALLCGRPGCVQMRPGSAFLNDLNRDIEALRGLDITSIYTPSDLMIVPPSSSVLPFGSVVKIAAPFHGGMLRDARVIRAVGEALR